MIKTSHIIADLKNHSAVTIPFPMWGLGNGNETMPLFTFIIAFNVI